MTTDITELLKQSLGTNSKNADIIPEDTLPPGTKRCYRCKTTALKKYRKNRLYRHHITYNPEITALLCGACHQKITMVNSIAAVVIKEKLSVPVRIKLWNWFVKFRGQVTEDLVAKALGFHNFKFTTNDYIRISTRRKLK